MSQPPDTDPSAPEDDVIDLVESVAPDDSALPETTELSEPAVAEDESEAEPTQESVEPTEESEESRDESGEAASARSARADLVEEGDVAADYLEGLLDIVDLDGDIDITVENDRAAVSVIEVDAGDLSDLVGADGEVLSALQDLTRLAVARETGHRSRLMLDIAGHRATRRSELQRLAREAVAEARDTGAPVRMAAMSPFERKVVHDEVAAAGFASESEGTEPNRYVVVSPA